jgi:Ca2+-binding EF-hand superfamily protein
LLLCQLTFFKVNLYAVLNRVRDQLNSRGANTIRSLGRVFRQLDSFDGNRKVDRQEFMIGLREVGVTLSPQDANTLFGYFDKNADGVVDFDEFLVGIRGTPNGRRQAMVDKAFLKFDRDGNGYIDANDLRGVYNASMHPKVQKGEMTADQVFMEFLSSFNDANKDGRIVREEWNEYYAAVSSSIDNDDHFVQLMKMAWRLD